jgi:hypothetical protein
VDSKEEDTARVWGVARTHDGRLPVELQEKDKSVIYDPPH